MSFIKDQLLDLSIEDLVQLHNEVVMMDYDKARAKSSLIHCFNEDGINHLFDNPWQFFKQMRQASLDLNEGDYFIKRTSTMTECFPASIMLDMLKTPINFNAIEEAIKEDDELAEKYDINLVQYEEHDIDEFIQEWVYTLSYSEKEDIARAILEELSKDGKVEYDTVYVEVGS